MSKITNKADLGKVAITVSSAPWNANTKYEKLTQVFLDGDSYVSLKDNKNVNPSTDTTGTWAKSTAHGKSLYELLNEKGLYDGTEEEFLAEWNKRAEDVDKDLRDFDVLNKEFKKTKIIVKNTVDNANTAIHEAGEATNLANSAASNAESATTRANAAAANAEGIKTSLDNFIAQGGGATDAQVIENTDNIATLRQQVIYDVSARNGGAVFGSLKDLLSSPNLDTLIPISVRHGGMSIRFVQSSDNNYVQFRCISNDFTTDVAQWAIAEEGVYVDNTEFVYVKTDAKDKILWAIKADGGIYYGAGCPQQVIDYINEKIADFLLDKYEDIVAFLDNLEKGDKTLQILLDEKVDKEEGKSLIDSDYASSQSAIDNSEYLQVTTDSEDKILEGIKASGIKEVNCPLETPSAIIGSDSNPEYKSVVTDANDRIIEGITSDNKKVIHIDTVFKGGVEGIETNMVQYNSVRDAAINNEKKLFTVGNMLYKNIVTSPSELFHKQDAYPYKYYDANGTLAQYTLVNNHKVINEEYIANKVKQEEIDFSPSDSTRTRIIVGKNDDDLFFVANVRMEYGSEEGVSSLNCLETTSDFITFTPIVKSANDQTKEAAYVKGYNNIVVKSVKQFANGDYIVAAGVNYQGWKTIFMLLSSDFSSISPITCTYLDGTTGVMADDFGNNVYDWHIDIKGSKCLVTTYGNRQPETDYGRVWYTEDNGVTWKQIFQMTNHYQDGVAPEDPVVTYVHVHGVMIDDYSNRLFVIAGEGNSNLFWSDKGFDTTDNDWNVIPIRRQLPLQQQSYMQVVNGYAFENNLVFGSDNLGAGAIYRINKLNEQYSKIQVAHEFLPNKFAGTFYCGAEMFRRDLHTPLFICETHENCMLTEEENEKLNEYHKARVVATYDGVNFVEIWLDDTFGTHQTYIANEGLTTRKFSWCTRGMNFYLLKNGNAILKYSGRTHNYFGGSPIYSVQGNSKGSCKIRKFYNIEKYL